MSQFNEQQQGFTLLEVVIALAVVGLVLGMLMSLLAESKRLAFKANQEISQIVVLRSALNVAQLLEEPEYPELPADIAKGLTLTAEEFLEKPERQTEKITLALEPYSYTRDKPAVSMRSVRWKKLQSVR